jgi:dTDP-L-rhamnose 4-epimerase
VVLGGESRFEPATNNAFWRPIRGSGVGNMKPCCLVTGGAGFIGTASAPLLVERFGNVLAVDNLHPQIHPTRSRPDALDARVELRIADICDPITWDEVLKSHEPVALLHLAAETGTGQSLTEASRHAVVNVVGLTRVLDALSQREIHPKHIVLASSRAIYGEGAWRKTSTSEIFYPGQRGPRMLELGQWDFREAEALPFVAGSTQPSPTSVYGATKLAQEYILRTWGQAFGVPISILRLQNVYGPGQSLTNSYTGIVSLFARIARRGESIPTYEDGKMLRDFIFIDDVARAIDLAFKQPPQDARTIDIGSGAATSIAQLATLIAGIYGAPPPYVTGQFRNGDVRHASCRVDAARDELDFRPAVMLPEGLDRLRSWMDRILA